MSTVFVMGGSGFIGTETVKALITKGDTVYGLARSQASKEKLAAMGAIPVFGDVYDPEPWIDQLPDIDYVINVLGFFTDGAPHRLSIGFAASASDKYIEWAHVLIRIAKEKKVKAAIHVTGATIYKPHAINWISESTPLRYEQDGFNRIASKATRLMVDAIKAKVPIIVAVAPNVVYGPVPNSSFEMVFVEPLRMNKMGVVGHGRNYIPTGHVEDVGRAISFVTDKKFAGEFFLISGDDSVTQKEFLGAIAKGIGKKKILHLPKPLVALMGGKAGAEFMSLSQRIDNTKLKEAGFEFKHPSFMHSIDNVMKELASHSRN
jgi:uncharacterized protein